MEKIKRFLMNLCGTLVLPLVVYAAMMLISKAYGKDYFGSIFMWKSLIIDITVSVTSAYAIGLQFKNGRFDFSGGAIMLISGIVAGNIAQRYGHNLILMVVLIMLVCLLLSILVGLFYVFGQLPVIISTIGMALLFESVSCIIYGGKGINIVYDMTLNKVLNLPFVFIPLLCSIAVYIFYSHFTVSGKQSLLLANNQQVAVNIGINEKTNVIKSYFYSGLLFGFATITWIAKNMHGASFSSLITVGELFSNILPVFIGLMLARFCGDTIGIFIGSLTLSLLSWTMRAVFTSEIGTSITTIITACFVLVLNVVNGKLPDLFAKLYGRRNSK